MDSIDKLLEQIKAEYNGDKSQQTQPPQPNFDQPSTNLPINLPVNLSINSANALIDEILGDTNQPNSFIDNILEEVKADIEAQAQAEELKKQQELEQERIKQEKIKAKQKAALKKQAQDWLAKLDPLSVEGLWFERFAESYPSKLEAAIEYLKSN
ncbi:salt stress protein, Slr1339 family [Nostoc sp. CMAA1605]|uniref:salt stress protein, Slr1339 family n=1 Tax=Nostoc sp. CMAA1605 TaxID=2055159 RepID=UPI001F3555E6|nr:hypothetical protein [Nostoc sp. CMAA1605]MCF4967021.1 hypothetical protein [Nostoc sp. CMAA1605]